MLVGKRLKRQDESCRIDLKNLHARCSLWSRRLGMAAQYSALV